MKRMDPSPSEIFKRPVGTRTKMLKIIYDHRERLARRNNKNRVYLAAFAVMLGGTLAFATYNLSKSVSNIPLQKLSEQWMNQVSVYEEPKVRSKKLKSEQKKISHQQKSPTSQPKKLTARTESKNKTTSKKSPQRTQKSQPASKKKASPKR